jgi:integrase
MAAQLLTDRACRNARADSKPVRLSDGGGLFLYCSPSGVKSWQFRYRNSRDKWQTATLGRYPDVSIADARERAATARNDAKAGHDLTVLALVRKMETATASATTFEAIAKSWMDSEAVRRAWTDDYREEVDASLRNHADDLMRLPVTAITAAIVYPVLDRIEAASPAMARKVSARVHAVLDHAVITGAITLNPVPRRPHARIDSVKNLPAILTLPELGAILRAAEAVDVCRGVKRAHTLAAFLVQRVGEIVGAEWQEFDLEGAIWRIPRERMKRKDAARGPHVIPIPPALLADLSKWKQGDGERARYACPAPRGDSHVTREALEKFYRRTLDLAGQHSPHSWRSAFSTICHDAGHDHAIVEAQLDHALHGANKVAGAYDRGDRLDARRDLLAWYEASLIAARDGARAIQIGRAA